LRLVGMTMIREELLKEIKARLVFLERPATRNSGLQTQKTLKAKSPL